MALALSHANTSTPVGDSTQEHDVPHTTHAENGHQQGFWTVTQTAVLGDVAAELQMVQRGADAPSDRERERR